MSQSQLGNVLGTLYNLGNLQKLMRRKNKLSVRAPPEAHAKFLLTYDDLLVGTLSVDGGVWRFEYSNEFRKTDVLRPIVEFPDVNSIYENEELWQFFASRIPSTEQAEVGAILRREHVEEDDAVGLLKLFGKRTIANPFELTLAA